MKRILSALTIAGLAGCGGIEGDPRQTSRAFDITTSSDSSQATCSGGPSIAIQSAAWDNPSTSLTGLAVTVQQNGATIATGSTPLTVPDLCAGQSYTIAVEDYQSERFAHWESGLTSSSRVVTVQTSAIYTAYYQVGGTIIPLYSWPTDASGNVVAAWNTVASEHQKWPATAVIPIANNQNGPGPSLDPNWTKGINLLVSGGCKVAGYVYTQYGKRSLTRVQREIRNWRAWYPQVTALFIDEMSNVKGRESYYSSLSSYARSYGFDFVIGNPGAPTLPSYIGTVDAMVIYENTQVPSSFSTWLSSYSPNNFATLSYAVPSSSFPPEQVRSNKSSVAYQYVTHDGASPDRNPWDVLSIYLDPLLSVLSP
jgi:spherulation-specific family 4 protein